MAKLRTGQLVLDRNEGQMLEGVNYVYVGVNTLTNDIILTPTTNNTPREIDDGDLVLGAHTEYPHVVHATEEGYVIEVNNLCDYIPEADYNVNEGATHIMGIVLPKYLMLEKVRVEEDEAYNDEELPESLKEVDTLIENMSSTDLKNYAKALGIKLIKKDWRKTIISKVHTFWKRKGVK